MDVNIYLIQNSQAVKKVCGPQKGYGEKRCEIQGGGQEMVVMVGYGKNFNNDNSGELLCRLVLAQNSPELSSLKFLPLTYHHSHFLATTLDFTSFFTIAFLRTAHFFYSLAVLD